MKLLCLKTGATLTLSYTENTIAATWRCIFKTLSNIYDGVFSRKYLMIKLVKEKLKTLQQMLQDFQRVFDHFSR